MCLKRLSNVDQLPSVAILVAAVVMLLIGSSDLQAAIVCPGDVSFSVGDLEKALNAGTRCQARAPHYPAAIRRGDWPVSDSDEPANSLELMKSSLPVGQFLVGHFQVLGGGWCR